MFFSKKKRKVFLSYSEKDSHIANIIRGVLLGELKAEIIPFNEILGSFSKKDSFSNDLMHDLFHYKSENSSMTTLRRFIEVKSNESSFYSKSVDEVYSFKHNSSLPGTNFRSIIESEMSESKIVIFLLSKESSISKWVNFEVNLADSMEKIVIPVQLEKGIDIPSSLVERQAILAYEKRHSWENDLLFAVSSLMSFWINDRLDLDKKYGNNLTFFENARLLFRNNYGFDFLKFVKR